VAKLEKQDRLDKSGKPVKMTGEQIALELQRLPEWSESGESIHRTYAFKDFLAAMGFSEERFKPYFQAIAVKNNRTVFGL
jgi:hypothetical protein